MTKNTLTNAIIPTAFFTSCPAGAIGATIFATRALTNIAPISQNRFAKDEWFSDASDAMFVIIFIYV
ncbi:hypothetical protein ACFQJ7_16510 [Halovenus rubra]|uniref:Uncharacterized protein n=2 Tax=Halovenus rubra TaxID=869890 RepID=A0ABD5X983_9EURY|nr:hypothetical protein [Halovenus rubra]